MKNREENYIYQLVKKFPKFNEKNKEKNRKT